MAPWNGPNKDENVTSDRWQVVLYRVYALERSTQTKQWTEIPIRTVKFSVEVTQ